MAKNQINSYYQKKIISITDFLCSEFFQEQATDLAAILSSEDIPVYYDHYEQTFDGLLTYDSSGFHIHIDIDAGNTLTSKRGRFTLAHELGHYFIDEHRIGLMKGELTPHPSKGKLIRTEPIELQADYFAANLLMPREKFRSISGSKDYFSLDILKELSDTFQASLLTTVLRFAEVGTHEIMVVFSKENKVKWYIKSYDFPKLPFKFMVSGTLPPTSVAGEYFIKDDSKYTTVENVDIEDWFYHKPWAPETQMHEQCFYSDLYDYVISIIWFD